MCGIAGFSLHPNEFVNARKLAVDLLLDIESRGRDATGAAWWEGGKVNVQKDALKAKEFVEYLNMPFATNVAILHTRAATQGSKRNCDNNHPVITGGIVGVHNGVAWNDDSLFRRMDIEDRRIGEVDTEAIFATIAFGQELTDKGKPRLEANLLDCLKEIRGSAAVGWLDVSDSEILHVARISSSPLVWAHTKKGSFIFASTAEAIRNAVKQQDLEIDCLIETREGTHLRVEQGRLATYDDFQMPSQYRSGTTTVTRTPATASSVTSNPGIINPNRWKPTPDPKAIAPAVNPTPDEVKPEMGDDLDIATFDEELLVRTGYAFEDLEYLLLPHHLGSMASTDYFHVYSIRESNIEDAIEATSKVDPEKSLQLIRENHGFVHPGCWVRTSLGGVDNVKGQLVSLSDDFPEGDYIIKLYVPNSRYTEGFEPVLVSRTRHEFEEIEG